MLDMDLQRFVQSGPPKIPNGLPDKPGPKLVSAKGTVERLVVVLENGEDLKAATERVLADGNVPAVVVTSAVSGAEATSVYTRSAISSPACAGSWSQSLCAVQHEWNSDPLFETYLSDLRRSRSCSRAFTSRRSTLPISLRGSSLSTWKRRGTL